MQEWTARRFIALNEILVPPGITNVHQRRPIKSSTENLQITNSCGIEEQSVDYVLRGNKLGGWLPPVGSHWRTDAKSILRGAPFTCCSGFTNWRKFRELFQSVSVLALNCVWWLCLCGSHACRGREFCLSPIQNIVWCFIPVIQGNEANGEIKSNDKIKIGWLIK